MQRWIPLLGTLFVALVFAVNLPGQNRPGHDNARSLSQHLDVADAIKVLDAWIEATVASRDLPGLSIGIVYDQELVWAKGYGFADLEKKIPASPSTVYRIASITKVFTATAVMQLRDAGKLRLDDPVVLHLPWFRIKNPFPKSPPITIRHLLTHTSGLPVESSGVNWNELKWPTRDEMIGLLSEQEAVFPAGTEFKYSNLGYAILGEIIGAASGKPYAQYIEEYILKPLGMTSTFMFPEPNSPGLAVGYRRRKPRVAREAAAFLNRNAEIPGLAAGNLATNVYDLAKFASLQFCDSACRSGQILNPWTLREMHRVQWLRADWWSGVGFGFESVRRIGEQLRVGMEGALPGYEGTLAIAPADKLAVIVLTNASDGNSEDYINQTFAIVGPAIARATAPPQTISTPDPAWDKYVGTYAWKDNWDELAEILVLNGELTMIHPNAENPWESRVTLKPVGPHTFRMIGGAWNGELLQFEVDPNGRVTRLRLTGEYWLRQ